MLCHHRRACFPERPIPGAGRKGGASALDGSCHNHPEMRLPDRGYLRNLHKSSSFQKFTTAACNASPRTVSVPACVRERQMINVIPRVL